MPEERYPNASAKYRNITREENKSGEREKKKRRELTPVAKGKERKKSLGEKITDSFLQASNEDIVDRVVFKWVIPGVKRIIEDVVHTLLFPNSAEPFDRGDRRSGRYMTRSLQLEDRRDRDDYRPRNSQSREPEVFFTTLSEAEDVKRELYKCLNEYTWVTKKDLYSLSDMPTDSTMYSWGWNDLSGIDIIHTSNGYVLKMPRMREIKR